MIPMHVVFQVDSKFATLTDLYVDPTRLELTVENFASPSSRPPKYLQSFIRF